nr:nucleotidyl transferase AbiEii/AbiGii toxin family protein [Mycolicibacterium chlorophenolicum]
MSRSSSNASRARRATKGGSLFRRPRHRLVEQVLTCLDAELLARHRCYFGGGTAIVLQRDEYRESLDIDFLVSDVDGYRELRRLVTGEAGVNGLTMRDCELRVLRPVRADQYGLRTFLEVEGEAVKFEIVFEGHLALDMPSANEHVCGVWTLAMVDAAACKLLANADRWADPSVWNRDVIDLAMLQAPIDVFDAAVAKAARAYGDAVVRCLNAAVDHLCADDSQRLRRAMAALQVDVPEDYLRQRITALRRGSA